MKRKDFLRNSLLAVPGLTIGESLLAANQPSSTTLPFVVAAHQSRFGDSPKFLGIHPNDCKISGKDTDGQLCVFEYEGSAKIGPALHIHFLQDEIFTVTEGEYRFVVGADTHHLKAGDTIFLPRNIPHTWIQLTDKGKLIYFLQPAGKMESFFSIMGNLKEKPSQEFIDKVHAEHDMKVVGAPLIL